MTVRTGDSGTTASQRARVAAVSGFIGSTLEFYDFFIYASATALFFDRIFFPDAGATGLLLSLSTMGVAYVARPLGAVIWGHFGDRLGRKKILLTTVLMMGVATFLVGCLPGYQTIGIAAPIILVVLRLVQGLSAGGESPGSSSLTLEHAPLGRRGFFAAWTISGIQFGIVISSLIFVPITALPDDQLLSWGWRIPFWLSAFVTVFAYFLRRRLTEPELFDELKRADEVAAIPFVELFRTDWASVIKVALAAMITMGSTIFTVFALAYATNIAGLNKSIMLVVIAVANVVTMITEPLGGWLSDKVGRKPIFIAGALGTALTIFGLLAAIAGGNWPLIFLTAILFNGICYALPNGVYPSFFPEQFSARVRYSGTAIGLMIGLVTAGFTPAIAQLLTAGDPTDWRPVAWMTAGFCVLSAVGAFLAKETYRTPTAELGGRPVTDLVSDPADQ
ncbi:MFS transporter [Microlunatus soli]|uniref:Predicted arabinose efflux permease, MFS family n=1 Tax=Microlunatus soli TaxID=630515 RepID=A0A1H1WHD4_9ACTN|nr:MFS transporter [Microlunatus soli]SDS96504.1 Predicted arabinose efflux permease, MFS family [Microlunatus soli]